MIDWSPLRQASLLRIIDTSRKAPQLDSLLELVLDEVATSISFTYAAVWLFDRDSDTWYIGLSRGLTPEAAHIRFPRGATFPCLVGERGTPLKIDDLGSSPTFQRLYPDHFRMKSALYAPMRVGGAPVGVIALYSDRPQAFNDDDVDFLTTVGKQLGVAVSFATLEESRRRLVLLEERDKIARDLHDGILQSLSSIKLYSEDALKSVDEGDLDYVHDALRTLVVAAGEAVYVTRVAVDRLRSSEGVLEDIRDTARRMKGRLEASGITAETKLEISELPPKVSDALAGICREAVNNILKHSYASCVQIEVSQTDDEVRLSVVDDGKGLEDDSAPLDSEMHLGIQLMKERIALVGGEFELQSERETGVVLRCRVPLTR